VKTTSTFYSFIILLLRAGLLVALFFAGWLVYNKLPYHAASNAEPPTNETTLQIVLRQTGNMNDAELDIPVELYPIDIVAVRHEYFTERRAGKRFDDFLNERMKGHRPVNTHLDKQGQTSIVVASGNWWLHALLPGEENLEWRLPVNVTGNKQTIELTSQNVYTRTKSF
jgi:hypothetical protein